MAPAQGPDTVDGRPEQNDTGEPLRPDTAITRSQLLDMRTEGGRTPSGLATIGAGGPDEEPALTPGERIGGFKIERQLGAGGMGQVFAAVSTADPDGEVIALKYLERNSAALLYRFKQEFRQLAGVTHENLVTLGELVALPDSGTFFTMELVDGVLFDEYVRGRTPRGEVPNLARLRRAMRQLVAGVRHLHKHDCIHRDLKPSNVLVTAEGRVVILDFGLVQDHSEGSSDAPDDQIMGTPAYMSPEQAGLERATPASDWYAVGVMLYECLTGKRPFRGTLTHLLFAKREFDPPDVTTMVEGVPEDLARLCTRLLARDPAQRPTGGEIAAILEGDKKNEVGWDPRDDPSSSMSAARQLFVGREAEISVLDAAHADLCSENDEGRRLPARQITVHVRGRSGYGKSALVREFLTRVRRRGGAVMLRGRCLERESVPYKGLDPVVDALSLHLRQLSREVLRELRPTHPAALVRLFPVLDDLWVADDTRTSGLDAHELRQRAFEALRELLDRLARREPLVVHIDDFQWGNVDSARLLTELLRPPDAPPMLVIVAYRDEVQQNEVLQALTAAEALEGRDVREVFVGPLPREEARELAAMLMGDQYDPAQAEAYAAGAEGSPFYVGQMVHGASTEGATPGQLDQIVVRRILQLDPDSRRLLEVVAVAGGPIARAAAFAASELDDPAALVPALREAELLRSRGGALETAHDRIREVTVGELEAAELRSTHRCIAEALERHGSDPEALAEHYQRGGDRLKAALYYQRAAEQAASSLAFAEAEALYRTTLDLLPEDADPTRVSALRVGLAEQLINVGRGHEAAALLLAEAEFVELRDAAAAREYRRRAADQLIKTGHVDEGLAELDKLLRSVGLRLPAGKAAAVSALLWEQTRLRMRGFGFDKTPESEVPPEVLDQIDTCFAFVNGLSTQETLLSALFHYRNIRMSLTVGEPYRVARALAYQCVIDVAGRDWRRVEEHFAVARELAEEVGDPQLSGFIDLCEASVHWFERRFPTSGRLHTRIIDSLEGVAGANWDRRTANNHHMWTLVCQGRLREFWARAKGATERARECGDMQEVVEVSAFKAVALVLAGQPEEARRVLLAAQAEWNPGRYLFGDVWAFYGHVRILFHEGEPEDAVALAKETLAQMKRTFLDQHLLARHNVEELLARAYLQVALLRDDPRYARRARRMATKLRAAQNPALTGQVAVIEAGLASLEGDRKGAVERWREALELFEAHEMQGHIAAIRHRLAQLSEGSEEAVDGEEHAAAAAAYFTAEDIEDVDGFLRVVVPARMDRLGVDQTPVDADHG